MPSLRCATVAEPERVAARDWLRKSCGETPSGGGGMPKIQKVRKHSHSRGNASRQLAFTASSPRARRTASGSTSIVRVPIGQILPVRITRLEQLIIATKSLFCFLQSFALCLRAVLAFLLRSRRRNTGTFHRACRGVESRTGNLRLESLYVLPQSVALLHQSVPLLPPGLLFELFSRGMLFGIKSIAEVGLFAWQDAPTRSRYICLTQ